MKTTGFQSPAPEKAYKELYGVKTLRVPTRKSERPAKVKKDMIFIPGDESYFSGPRSISTKSEAAKSHTVSEFATIVQRGSEF